jgi:hypothetical protein
MSRRLALLERPPNKALQRTDNNLTQLTFVAVWRHTVSVGSVSVSVVAGR